MLERHWTLSKQAQETKEFVLKRCKHHATVVSGSNLLRKVQNTLLTPKMEILLTIQVFSKDYNY